MIQLFITCIGLFSIIVLTSLVLRNKSASKVHIFDKVVSTILILLIVFFVVIFLVNKRDVYVSKSHKRYTLELNKPLNISISEFSKYDTRPLVIDGIFDFPFEIARHNGVYDEWSYQIQITQTGSTETMEALNYSAVQSGFASQIYQFPTDGITSFTLLLNRLEKTGGNALSIKIGRDFDIDAGTVDELLFIVIVFLSILFAIYSLIIYIRIRRRGTGSARANRKQPKELE